MTNEEKTCRNCTHYNLFGLDENTTYCAHPALYCNYFTPKAGDSHDGA